MYIPLHNKSNYSLLSSLLKIDDLISYAKKNNISCIALTDNNMFGAMEFIRKCEKNNIKPIIGLTVILNGCNFVLIAKTYDGYKSLIKLATIQSERVINDDDLKKYNKDLIAIVPFAFSSFFDKLSDIYVDIYLGYSNKKEELESAILTKNIVFFRENLYLNDSDSSFLDYLYRIRDNKTVSDDISYDIYDHELYINNYSSLSSSDGINRTYDIALKCNLVFPPTKVLLPIFDCSDPFKYLTDLCKVGLKKRLGGKVSSEYQSRLLYELNIINDMGFSNYFLIVYDYIKFAKKNDILVGPGRGSAAGSLVAYSLGITDIDPIEYGLLFERFLNPERKTMPDIDTDFPDDKRNIVVDYVKNKYGVKRVGGIITFGTMAAKQSIRDVSRVLNIPLYKVDSLCKYIPSMSKDKLADIYNNNESFKIKIDSDILLSKMFKIACFFEGFPRHTSSHAAGIVMCQDDLDEIIPLVYTNDLYLTGYSMEYLEDLGLLKMDFLVLKNLTLIDNILKDIRTNCNQNLKFSDIPLNDVDTIKLFETANTCGVFQFESSGMRNFLRKIKPKTFDDIFAAIALFRPGAALNIDQYVNRKEKKEHVTYLDPSFEDITKSTYGLLIYQEQIMQVANSFAGYSLGEADILRRAMSKKKLDLLKAEEDKFIKKSMLRNHSYDLSKKVFDLILNFAGYGFNKSHSVVYSIIAYKMAYLKCHYPTIFFANLLTNVIGSESKTKEYIMEAKANKISVLKPDILYSDLVYTIVDDKIVYPISNIKGIGSVVSAQIKIAREDGPFIDIYDAFSRLFIAGVNKKSFEILIYADVFKSFYNRATLIYNLDSLFNYAELTKDIDPSLVMKPDICLQNEFSNQKILECEKNVFGFYFSSHPVAMYRKDNVDCINLNDILYYLNKSVSVLILVDSVKVINTKNGDKMAFLVGSDETDSNEFILFPKVFKMYKDISKGLVLKVNGIVEKRLDKIQLIVDKISVLQGDSND